MHAVNSPLRVARVFESFMGVGSESRPVVNLNMRQLSAMRSAAACNAAEWWRFCRFVALLLFCAVFASPARADETNPPPAAKFKISGYGFLGDLRLKRIIKLLEVPKKKPEFFDANFMEDTALILKSKVREDGYLNPTIVITAYRKDEKNFVTKVYWSKTKGVVKYVRSDGVYWGLKYIKMN